MVKVSFAIFIVISTILQVGFVPSSLAETKSYEDFSELDNELLVLGDVLKVGSGYCYSSSQVKQKAMQKRLQAFVLNKWINVGSSKFVKNSECPKLNKFEQVFTWEIDRIGEIVGDRTYVGKLRLRNPAASPSEYAAIRVLESESAASELEGQQAIDFLQFIKCNSGDPEMAKDPSCAKWK